MRILFTVGTSKYSFSRFFDYATQILPFVTKPGDLIYIQHGFNPRPIFELDGVTVNIFSFVSVEDFSSIFNEIDQVVTHGAAGTIMQCNQVGVRPLVVCRNSKLHEHVDDHQISSATKFSSLGLCKVSAGHDHDCEYLSQNNFISKTRLSGNSLNNYLNTL